MNYKLVRERNKIIKEVWEKYRNEFSMEELAEIFNLPLSTFYRILKEQKVEVKK